MWLSQLLVRDTQIQQKATHLLATSALRLTVERSGISVHLVAALQLWI